jgi:hypothetical protein
MRDKYLIHQLPKEEVRMGWVRIPKISRGDIKPGSLIVIQNKKNKVGRIVLGLNDNKLDKNKKHIFLDEPTRKDLGVRYGTQMDIEIIKPNFFINILNRIIHYWKHPDFVTNFSIKIAVVSLLIAIIALIWGILY